MSLFERMERKLERTVNGVFAKAFRSEVQPLELASAVRRAMDDRATLIGRGRTAVPNLFTIELSPGDYDRLTEYDEELEDELIAACKTGYAAAKKVKFPEVQQGHVYRHPKKPGEAWSAPPVR